MSVTRGRLHWVGCEAPGEFDVAKVFLSYSSRDRELASIIAARLEQAGISVWWDRALLGGDEFRSAILAQLRASSYVVVLWTTHSVRSQWVQDEADEAKSAGRLIPLIHADIQISDVELGFRQLHMLETSDIETLIETVEKKDAAGNIGSLVARKKQGLFLKVMKNPLLYIALSSTLLLYIIFPGFLLGLALGLGFILLLLLWASS